MTELAWPLTALLLGAGALWVLHRWLSEVRWHHRLAEQLGEAYQVRLRSLEDRVQAAAPRAELEEVDARLKHVEALMPETEPRQGRIGWRAG